MLIPFRVKGQTKENLYCAPLSEQWSDVMDSFHRYQNRPA